MTPSEFREDTHKTRMIGLLCGEETMTPRFQGHDIIQRQKTRKWYKIALYLQWPTNRKSHYGRLNGAMFNDLERPLTWFSRSRHSLTLNISEMAKHTAIVTM